ncbi:MAG: NosD domain-containing protein [Nanoarchaeota archaeon]|nr:NosD domain-containing protein [Nanoarchaeota archaeon]
MMSNNEQITKQLKDYIDDNMSKGYSLESIKEALLKAGYQKRYINSLVKDNSEIRKDLVKYSAIASILVIISLSVLLIEPAHIGFLTITQDVNYVDNINLTINNTYEYTWHMNKGALKSLKLDGKITKQGSAKAYLKHKDKEYLIFDSSKLSQQGITAATGLVISQETGNLIPNENIKQITIETKDLGIKDTDEVFELNTNSNFNWNIDYNKLCTKWDINDITVCYGSDVCCALLNQNSQGNWNATLYLSYGRHDSILQNTIRSQVIYANYSLDINNPYSDIIYSNIEEFKAIFHTPPINFNKICLETCLLPELNDTEYKIIFVVENAELNINSIQYSTQKEIEISRNTPKLDKNFDNLTIYKNQRAVINLSEYFSDEDNDILTYSSHNFDDINIIIKNSVATITPNNDFTGKAYLFFRASDRFYNISSNIFSIRVIEPPKEFQETDLSETLITPKIVINQPVKWVKQIDMPYNVINLSVDLPSHAIDINIKDIKENKIISEKNIIVEEQGITKNLALFKTEKRIEQIEKTEERLEERRNTITKEKPTAKQEISSINRELLNLKNERNILTGYAVSYKGKGLLTRWIESLLNIDITGYAVKEKQDSGKHLGHNKTKEDKIKIIIEEPVEDVEIEYYTEAPLQVEETISEFRKVITISAPDELGYTNILAYTTLPIEAKAKSVDLYRIINNTRQNVEILKYDTNNNSLIDYIEWTVPHLSNATYEVSITILNVHSHPSLYGNWTVEFNTTGTANLTITASIDINYSPLTTRWSDYSDNNSLYDLKFLEIKCGNENIEYEWQGQDCAEQECSVFIENFSCSETTQEISKVLTAKKHILKFNFGNQEAYAYNDIAVGSCTIITSQGWYNLTNNITDSSSSKCIEIQANNVTLDCLGNKIDGNNIADYGIYVYKSTIEDTNITIKDCTVSDWASAGIYLHNANNNTLSNLNVSSNPDYGIYLDYSSYNTITNSTVDSNHRGIYINYGSKNTIKNISASSNSYGIYIDYSSNNTILNTSSNNNAYGIRLSNNENNTVDSCYANDNTEYGIFLYDSSNNIIKTNYLVGNSYGFYIDGTASNSSLIYNNFINSTKNYAIVSSNNTWNTSKSSGTNIVDSIYFAGNYWANYSAVGFSDNCNDVDGDRICDASYSLSLENIDYLPLTYPDNIIPNINFTDPTTQSGNYSQNYILANVTASDTYLNATIIYLYNAAGLVSSNSSIEYSQGASPFFTNFTALPDGVYYLNATANDTSNNKNSTETRTIRLDTTSPSFSNNKTNATSTTPKYLDVVQINLDINDSIGLSSYVLAHNDSGTMTNTTIRTISGNYTIVENITIATLKRSGILGWQVWVNDSVGNINVSDKYTLEIRNTPPTTPSIIYPISGNNYSDIPYINYSSSDVDGGTITYSIYINGTLNMSTTSNMADWNATDGYYNLTVSANDGTSSSSNSSEVYFTLDTTAPSFRGNWTNASSVRVNGNATFNITISDNFGLSYYIFSWNGTGEGWLNDSAKTISGTSIKILVNKTTNLTRGNNIAYRWYANDSAGNLNLSILRTFTVVNTPPTTPSIIYPISGNNYSDIPYINYSSSDVDGDTITYSIYINGTLNMSTTSNMADWNATDGYYNLTVSANDGTSSSSNSSEVYFTLDTTAPSFRGNWTNASSVRVNGNATFNITISDNFGLSYYIFSWNGTGEGWLNDSAKTISGTSIKILVNKTTNLTRGNNIAYRWYANDSAGNLNLSILRTFTVVNTPPSTPTIIYPISGGGYTDIPYMNYSSSDPDGGTITYSIYINGTLNMSTTSNMTDWNATDGYYNLTVSASDSYDGSANSSEVRFTLDATPPTVTIIYPTNGSNISSNSIDLNISTNEAGLTFYWVINGTLNSTTIDTNSSMNASDGYYNLTVFVGNGLINGSSSVYFTIDTTAPTIYLISPINNVKTNKGNQTFTCNITDNSAIANLTLYIWNSSNANVLTNTTILFTTYNQTSWNYTLPASGIYKWNCLGYDYANNLAWGEEGNYTIDWDTTPPNITATSPSGTVYTSQSTLQATTDENATCKYIPHTEGNITTNYSSMPYNLTDRNTAHTKIATLANAYYEFYVKCNDTIGNVMNESGNISFTVNVQTQVVEGSGSGGGGGGGGSIIRKNITKKVLLEISVPPSKTLFPGEAHEVVIEFENKGDFILNKVNLETSTNAPDLELSFSKNLFNEINLNGKEESVLTIRSLAAPKAHIGINRYSVSIYAKSEDPEYEKSISFFITIEEKDFRRRSEVIKEMKFAEDLFDEHPECEKFMHIMEEAEEMYHSSEYDRMDALIKSAIEACKDLVASQKSAKKVEEMAPERKFKLLYIFIIIGTILALMMGGYYARKMIINKELSTAPKADSASQFEETFNITRNLIGKGKLDKAKKGYVVMYNLYNTIDYYQLPPSTKLEHSRKISTIYSELVQAYKGRT